MLIIGKTHSNGVCAIKGKNKMKTRRDSVHVIESWPFCDQSSFVADEAGLVNSQP